MAMPIATNIGTKGLGNANGVTGTPVDSIRNRESNGKVRSPELTGAEFKKSLADSISESMAGATGAQPTAATQPVVGAKAALQQAAIGAASESLKFSAHAVDRMKSRGISFAPDMMKGIESAVSRAAAKGSKDALVLAGDNALIVSVKNNTVVTVMDKSAMRENVFTNIDSTVFA